jgi:hypothetical protein
MNKNDPDVGTGLVGAPGKNPHHLPLAFMTATLLPLISQLVEMS